jgi:hypothetical protein
MYILAFRHACHLLIFGQQSIQAGTHRCLWAALHHSSGIWGSINQLRCLARMMYEMFGSETSAVRAQLGVVIVPVPQMFGVASVLTASRGFYACVWLRHE